MDLKSLILVLSGYNKIFYLIRKDKAYSQYNELTIRDCVEFANYEVERVCLTRDGEENHVLIELGGPSIEDIFKKKE